MRDRESLETKQLEVISLQDCNASARGDYIVQGLISPADHVVMIGNPGSGKSVIAPLLAYSIATGRPIFNRRVNPGPALYLSPEDG